MKNLGPVLRGILIALVSVGLLFGGLSLSLAENKAPVIPTPTTEVGSPTPTRAASATFTPRTILTNTRTTTPEKPTLTLTETRPPTPTNCPPPTGWSPYVIKSGDTLANLSTRFRVSVASLTAANCLTTSELIPGSIIYTPPSPTSTRVLCGAPAGWVLTFVQTGDTLYRLSLAYGVSVSQLQLANCMGSSTLLRVGQSLYVPPGPTRTPAFPTLPVGDTPTFVPTNTFSSEQPTSTTEPVDTSTNTPSYPTDVPTFIPTP